MTSLRRGNPRIHRHTLVEMNRSVCTARRNSAHDRVVALLAHVSMALDDIQRRQQYEVCLGLLDDAIMATRRSQLAQDTPVTHYFTLLYETLRAQVSLVSHQIRLYQEAREFADLLGSDSSHELDTVRDFFAGSEKNVIDSLSGLIRFGTPILRSDTEDRLALFTDDEHRRYEVASQEFEKSYLSSGAGLSGADGGSADLND